MIDSAAATVAGNAGQRQGGEAERSSMRITRKNTREEHQKAGSRRETAMLSLVPMQQFYCELSSGAISEGRHDNGMTMRALALSIGFLAILASGPAPGATVAYRRQLLDRQQLH